jgi:hypothetical protein
MQFLTCAKVGFKVLTLQLCMSNYGQEGTVDVETDCLKAAVRGAQQFSYVYYPSKRLVPGCYIAK